MSTAQLLLNNNVKMCVEVMDTKHN